MDRRGFIKTTLVAGTAALAGNDLCAQETRDPKEFVGILVDTTRCIGCRACEVACGEEHDMLVPDVLNDGALEKPRNTSDKQWMVVNKHQTEKGEVFVKSNYRGGTLVTIVLPALKPKKTIKSR